MSYTLSIIDMPLSLPIWIPFLFILDIHMISSNSERTIHPPPTPTGSNSRLVDEVRRRKNIISILMSVNAIRVIIGISFVIGVTQGILLPIVGYTAGIGDILIGITALPMVYFFRRGHHLATNVARVWNVLGMLDLVTAIYLGITTPNTLFASAANMHPTMTTMPWVLIPAVGVPILLTIHIITLLLLRQRKY